MAERTIIYRTNRANTSRELASLEAIVTNHHQQQEQKKGESSRIIEKTGIKTGAE